MELARQQLVADNEYFKKLISLIPANLSNLGINSNDISSGMADATVRDRLHEKIAVLKDKRLKPGKAVDSLEKKRLKRKLSKSKLRQKRKAEKQQQSADNKMSASSEKKPAAETKPVFNKEGNVVFSKFEFSDNQSSSDKQKSGVITGKNYKVLLDQVEKQKSKIKKIQETNPGKAKSMEEKLKWKSALSKAEGVKVRDNPELLKKSLKKREKKKEYSRQKWDDREQNVAQQMKQRQDKRAKNIAKKKEGRKENKIKLAKKRGRVVI